MEKIIQFLKRNLLPLLLVLVTSFLCFRNYTPNTWLSGWDTLHPEFNFPLNLKRVIFGVWRQEQGLGAVAGHSHMADLPRILLLWVLSLVFPVFSLRYLYIFLCLILGPLGVYFFIKYLFSSFSTSPIPQPFGLKILNPKGFSLARFFPRFSASEAPAFLGGLFYLLNLGTLQHFYVPFEMFPTLYAALPWLFLFASRFLERKKRGDLTLFSLITFFAIPMAYAAHLWYVYFLCLALYLLALSLLNKSFKPTLILFLFTLIINSYWLLPNLYFLANHAQNVPLAKINQLFSEEAFLANKEFGTIENTAILKSFLFNWNEYADDETFDYLLNEWRNHLEKPWIGAIGYGSFCLVIIGTFISILKKEKLSLALLPVFLTCFLLITNNNPILDRIFTSLRANNPLIKEGLRFSFTKLSLPLMFAYAVYFAQATNLLLTIAKRITKSFLSCYFFLFTFSFLLFLYMLPAFSGHLISPSMRIRFPQEYFELFAWFNEQKGEGRIAHFPIHSPYGWVYYDWNLPADQVLSGNLAGEPSFQGAGFLWFGIKQPFLDRDFDRWNPANEQYYQEMSYAVYSENLPLVEKILEKYQIKWVLLDENIIIPGNEPDSPVLHFNQIKRMFDLSKKISLAKKFGSKIRVYQVNFASDTQSFAYPLEDFVLVEPGFSRTYKDQAYWENGNYVSTHYSKNTSLASATSIYYPFRTFQNEDDTAPTETLLQNVQFPIPSEPINELNILSLERQPKSCSHPEAKFFERKIIRESNGGYIEYISERGSTCDHFDFPNLAHNQGYLLTVEARNLTGLPLRLCLTNYQTRRCDLYTNFPKTSSFKKYSFIIPPMGETGTGFDLNIDNYSVGRTRSINHLKTIAISPFPYNWLKEMRFVSEAKESKRPDLLVFNQSFEKGWKALVFTPPFSLKQIAPHVLVNNWANGWLLNETRNMRHETRMYIVFFPQVLEYLGFGLWLAVPLLIKCHSERSEESLANARRDPSSPSAPQDDNRVARQN